MNAKTLIRYSARGLSVACIAALIYHLFCLRGF